MRFALPLMLLSFVTFAQPTRTFHSLPSSNGYGAVIADTSSGKVVHFRERLPAAEEPQLDAMGNEVWVGNQPQLVKSRDLMFDAYFGLRGGGQQQWLNVAPTDSGYETAPPAASGGSGIVTWRHASVLGLEATTYVFAPRSLPHAGFVMALRLKNTGSATVTGVSAFSLHNLHLGYGRPGVMQKLAANGETVVVESNGDLQERGFAGVVVARPVGGATRATAWNPNTPAGQNGFTIVNNGGAGDLVARTGDLGVADDQATAFQFDLGDVAAGAEKWVAVAVAHHGDPFGVAAVQGWLDAYVGSKTAGQLVDGERAAWSAFQQALTLPSGLSASEATVARQSAVVLAMAQVKEREAFLREHLTQDGEPRRSRFATLDGGALPNTVTHRGYGAVLASLPPGEWTYAWIRDGAYAATAMSALGMEAESRDALAFYLDAEGGRFQTWTELNGYGMPPYVVSLVRYVGFGVEETDFNGFGPNLEFDGFGLFLWALRQHEVLTGDTSLADARWNDIATKVADPLVALVDPATGLIRPDSSIWETHWNGRQRAWTYTSLTAARGLCDAAAIAQRRGDLARVMRYRQAAQQLRAAIALRLTDSTGALASNREELQAGSGYYDAAVLDALAMGLFDPSGRIGQATTAAMESKLRVSAGPGWARNDDRVDHSGQTDLSPWGSDYDSAEWVITDLRGEVAVRAQGNTTRANALLDWVTANAAANAGLVPETFDEATGAWKFNAPMVGFGAGAYVLALAQRAAGSVDPACGAFFDETTPDGGVGDAGAPDAGMTDAGSPDAGRTDAGVQLADGGSSTDGGTGPGPQPTGCGCTSVEPGIAGLLLLVALRRRRRAVP